MSLVVNTNVGSLNAQRSLAASGAELKTAMERLSSGSKINSASDDAAGFAIAERMTAQIRGLNMAAKNAGDGLSMLAAIENATNDVTDMLQRMRELAVQAVNDTNTAQDRAYLQQEVTGLIAEIDRVANQTQYNGQAILDGSLSGKIQVGTEAGQTVNFDIKTIATDVLGVEVQDEERQITFNGDFENGSVGDSTISGWDISNAQVRLNGVDNLAGQPTPDDGSFPPSVDNSQSPAYDSTVNSATYTTTLSGETPSGSGTSLEMRSSGVNVPGYGILHGPSVTSSEPVTLLKGDTVSFDWRASGGDDAYDIIAYLVDVNTGHTEEILNETGATASASTQWDKASLEVGKGGEYKFVFVSGTWDATGGQAAGAQLYIDNVEFEATGASPSLATIDLESDASSALAIISTAIEQVAGQRAEYGALQNRLEYTVSNLMNVSEFTTAARSRIADADFAAESARLAKAQVLQQTGTAMLAQANASSQLALSLIR